jgi:hypothetical protein
MSLRVISSKLATRVPQGAVQKRNFLDWMTHYPDRVRCFLCKSATLSCPIVFERTAGKSPVYLFGGEEQRSRDVNAMNVF